MRAGKTGKISGIVQWWTGGRRGKARRVTIGHYGQPAPAGVVIDGKPLDAGRIVTAELLRKLAAAQIARIKAGENPAEDRKRAPSLSHTFHQVVARYLNEQGKGKRSWNQTRRALDFELSEGEASHDLASQLFADLKRRDFVDLRDRIAARSPNACRMFFAHLSGLMGWAVEKELISENVIKGLKLPPPPSSRQRILEDDELAACWTASERLEYPMRDVYRLLILTGMRKMEVAEMTWSEIDLKAATWTIPGERTKNKREHVVDLSPQAIQCFNGLHHHLGTDLVFPFKVESKFQFARLLLDEHMTIIRGKQAPAWRTHDLRRTVASGMAGLGVSPYVADRCINHVTGTAVMRTYQRHEFRAERKAAFAVWGAHVERLVSGNVIQFREVSNG